MSEANINKQLTRNQVIKNIYEARYRDSDTCEEKMAVETILDAARSVLEEKFRIETSRETLSIIYQTMFIEAYRFLTDRFGEVKAIELGDSCIIGISNSRTVEGELDNETVGNFIPSLEDTRHDRQNTECEHDINDHLDECRQRNVSSSYLANEYVNCLPNNEIFTIIESRAVEVLKEKYGICVPFSHILVVMWKAVYDSMCIFIETQAAMAETKEYQLSFQGLIESHGVVQEDGTIKVIHFPERCIKLVSKNDINADNEFMQNLSQVLMLKHKNQTMCEDRTE